MGFVAPHSLMPPRRMVGVCRRVADAEARFGPFAAAFARRPGSGRLLYNFVSAVTLHFLLARFTPLTTPTVAALPFPKTAHACLSVACLLGAVLSMLAEPATFGLLGLGQFMGWSRAYATPPPGRMDAITWMGVSAWRGGKELLGERFLFATYGDAAAKKRHAEILGATCFVLFTGVSILPAELTFGDCLTRGIAAFYLRRRSKSFREWVASVEGAHVATWGIRALLLFAAFRATALKEDSGQNSSEDDPSSSRAPRESTGALSPMAATACAAATALILRFAERPRGAKRLKTPPDPATRPDATTQPDATTDAASGSARPPRVPRCAVPAVSVVEVSFRNVDAKGASEARRSARISSRAA